MASTSTAVVVLDHLLNRGIGQRLENAEITSIAAGNVTSAIWYRRARFGSDELRNGGMSPTTIWRPAQATGIADDYRDVGALTASTGAIANDANWSDTTLGTEDVYLIFYGIQPLWIIEAMNRALRDVYFWNEGVVSWAADADFQSTSTSLWTASNTTLTKITTDGSGNAFPYFIASGFSNASGANGYLTQEFATARGAEWFTGVLVRVDAGTFSLVWRDVTNSADLGTAISTTEEAWVYVERRESVTSGASGTENVGFRLQNTGASDDLYFNGAWFWPTDAYAIPLASTWDTPFKVPQLAYLTFSKTLADGVWDARSMQKHLIPRDDYEVVSMRAGANPYGVHFFDNKYLRYPIIIEGRRAHSDVDGPFTRLMTETTSADLDLFEAAVARRLFADERVQCPEKDRKLAKAEADYRSLSGQFVQAGPVKRRDDRVYSGLRR